MEGTAPPDSTEQVQFVSGVELYERLKDGHNALSEKYETLLTARREFLVGQEHVQAEAHAFACQSYVRCLLTFTRPAQGRLPHLLGLDCTEALSEDLLLDFLLQVASFKNEISPTTPPATAAETSFLAKMTQHLRDYAQTAYARPSKSADMKSIFTALTSHDFKNPHSTLEADLKEANQKYEASKTQKVQEIVAQDKWTMNRRELRPETGVLICNTETADAGSDVSYVERLQSFLPLYGESYSSNVGDYIRQFGAEIIVALDKLESMCIPAVKKEWLQIYLEIQTLVARTGSSATPPEVHRRDSCLSPNFAVDYASIFALFSNASPTTHGHMQCNSCAYLRNVNSATAFYDFARSESCLNLLTETHVRDAALHQNVYLCLESLILKILMSFTEQAVLACVERRDSAIDNTALKLIFDTLKEVIGRLSGEKTPKCAEGEADGNSMLYSSLAKYFLLPVSIHLTELPKGDFGKLYFLKMEVILRRLCFLPMQSDLKLGETATFVTLTDKLAVGLLSVLRHFLSTDAHQKYLSWFRDAKLPLLMDAVLHHVSERVSAELASLLKGIILNIKMQRVKIDGNGNECPSEMCSHHVGDGLSVLLVDAYDPRVCEVSMFVSMLLSLYTCFDSAESALTCINELSQAGLCCCMTSHFVLEKLLSNLALKKPVVVERTLEFIKQTVIENLNGLALQKSTDCFECQIKRVSKAKQPPDDERPEGVVFIRLATERTEKIIQLYDTNKVVRSLASARSLNYVDLKWTGLAHYKTALGSSLNPAFHNHFLYLTRFGSEYIQNYLFEHIYRVFVERTLKTSFCTQSNLNKLENVYALSSTFSALSFLLLTNENCKLTLSDGQWLAWKNFFYGNSKTKSVMLARACFSFGCALICCIVPSVTIPPFSKEPERHAECFSAVDNVLSTAQEDFLKFLRGEHDPAAVSDIFDRELLTWSVLAELSCVPVFLQYMNERFFKSKTVLEPIPLLVHMLNVLDTADHKARLVLLKHRLKDTCALVRSLLTLVAASTRLPSERAEIAAYIGQHLRKEKLDVVHPGLMSHLFSAFLDASCDSLLNAKSGVVDALCGCTADRPYPSDDQASASDAPEADILSLSSTSEVFDILPQILHWTTLSHDQKQKVIIFPEIVPMILQSLVYYHEKVVLCLKTDQELQQRLGETADDNAGIVATALGSWFGSAATPDDEVEQVEKLAHESDHSVSAYSNCLERVLEKALFLARQSEEVSKELLKESFNTKQLLLSGFSSVLKDSANYQGAASLLLKLWESLASVVLTAAELKQFFTLFMGANPPVDSLLRTLSKLLEKHVHVPRTVLVFGPFTCDALPDSTASPGEGWTVYNENGHCKPNAEPVPPNGLVSKSPKLTETQRCFLECRANTMEMGFDNSGMARSRVACVFGSNETNWLPVRDSTTAAFWCQVHLARGDDGIVDLSTLEGTEENAIKIHLFSFGVKMIMVSAFLNTLTGTCHVELRSYTSPDEPSVLVLNFQLDWSPLLHGQWHFVTFSLPDHNTKKPAAIPIEFSIDGKLQKIEVRMKALGTLKTEALYVLLGNRCSIVKSSDDPAGSSPAIKSCSMTNFFLFSCPRLDELKILLLMAHGKDATNFLNWNKEENGDFMKKFLTPTLVSALRKKHASAPDKTVAEALGGLVHNALSSLLPTMLFQYNCATSDSFLCYARTSSTAHESRCSYNTAAARPCLVFDGPLQLEHHQKAHHALLQLGGAPTLLRLLARVVELNATDYSEIPRSVYGQDNAITHFGQADTSSYMPVDGHVDELSFSKPSGSEMPKPDSATGDANDAGLADKTIGSSSSSSSAGSGASKSQAWCQAETVRILLWCVKHVPEIGKQFHAMNGTELLMRLLYSPKMDTRLELLKVLIENCISEPVLTLDRLGSSAVCGLPVHGVFRQPGPHALLTDASLLAAILRHWHRVEVSKLEMRKAAPQGGDARLPERLVVDWCYGCCHSVDVLHRAVGLLSHPANNALCAFNAWQLRRISALHLLLNMAQELLVLDWPEMQVTPRVLQATLLSFVPPQRDSDLQLPSWSIGTVRELLNYLVLRVEPCRALVWHSESCTGRLLKIYSSSSKLAEPSKTQRIIGNILEINLAEGVAKELTRQSPKLDSSVVAQEGKGLLTKEDQDRLSSTNSSYEAIDMMKASLDATVTPATEAQDQQTAARATTRRKTAVVEAINLNVDVPYVAHVFLGREVIIGSLPKLDDPSGHSNSEETSTEAEFSTRDGKNEQQSTVADGPEASNQTSASNLSSAEGELKSPRLASNGSSEGGSGRSSPLCTPPAAVPNVKLNAVDAHLIAALHDFLLFQDERKFTDYISECVKPNHLALLANHGSVVVRTTVMKIFRQILCRRAPSLRNLNIFKDQLMIVHHQFACKDSSDDLLLACLNLVISKPGHSVDSSDYVLITDDLRTELKNAAIQDHILETSAPLLAVLPKLDGQSFETVDKVLVFLSTMVEMGSCNRGKLLAMENLPESLLLTLQSFLKESRFRGVPVANIIIDLCRSLLMQSDDSLAAKGLDLITKLYLLSESSNGKTRTAAVDVLGRTLINSMVCLMRVMMVVSSKMLSKTLLSLRLAKKRDKCLAAEESEHRSNELFGEITSQYEDYLVPVSPQLATAIEAVGPSQTNFVFRTIKILKMASIFLLKLDWVSSSTTFSGTLYHGLPLFLLDLQKKLLVVWDDATSHSGRMGFASSRHLPSHQFEVLSREYELEMRSALPELLCLLVTPSAPMSLFSDVLRRLAKDPRTLRSIFVYCRDRAYPLFSVIGHYLAQKSKKLQPGSQAFGDCDRVISAYEAVGRPSLYRDDARISRPETAMKDHLQRRLCLADYAVLVDVKTCVAVAVKEHEEHRKKISNVYNKFLIMHANLKKTVLDDITRSEQSYHDMTKKWLQLGSDAFNDQSPWTGNTPSWWELLDYVNVDKSRSLLGRTLLKVHPKFLMEAERAKASINISDDDDYHPDVHLPLYSVLNDGSNLLHGNKENIFRSDGNERAVDVQIACKGWIVKPGIDWPGTIFVTDGIHFRGVKTVCSYGKKLDVKVESSLHIAVNEIAEVRLLRYRLRELAFEVHLFNKKSWLFVCDSENDRNSIAKKLRQAANLPPEVDLRAAVRAAYTDWKERRISNFDYLLSLNFLAGRTYNDLNQYPVFPYVLADYSSETLDITDPKIYRDLSKPMPVQTPDREQYFAERFEKSKDMSPHGLQFHYSSLYSNCVIVPNYLVRLPPFTLYFLHFQGGKFDEPTRTFKDLEQTYKNITKDTYGDFKEAIPEMYYLPEMFCNSERFDLRALSDGTLVDHVQLPKWCRGNRRIFVLGHRAALESAFVTTNLPSWIDLVFGFKQIGEKARAALNVYHPQGYPENLGTDDSRAWQEAISMYGEVPSQLFSGAGHHSANPLPKDIKLSMQFPHTPCLTALPIKGLQLHSFAFFPINNNAFYADPGMNCILLNENIEPVISGANTTVFHAAPRRAIVMLDKMREAHVLQMCAADGVARVWSPGHAYPYPAFSLPSHLKVTCQAYEDGQVWLGTDGGLVLVYNVTFCAAPRRVFPASKARKKTFTQQISEDKPVFTVTLASSHELTGTQARVTAVWLCPRYNVCVSGDAAGTCCVWDIRQPALLRTVACFTTPVACVGVSSTSGDWVAATDLPKPHTIEYKDYDRPQAALQLYSVNGVEAAKATCEAVIRKFAFTSLVEGRTLNVIAAICDSITHNVVLYSSWDLMKLQSVHTETPIRSLKWSTECHQLLVHYANKRCRVYQSQLAETLKMQPATIQVVAAPSDCVRAFE